MTAPSPEDILLRAAVCGRFDPAALLADCDETAFLDLSGRLAKLCEEVILEKRYGWRLRAEARRESLAGLSAPVAARALLAATTQLVEENDPFADELRLLLGGRISRKKDGRDERLNAARFALLVPALADRRTRIDSRVEDLRQAIEIEQADVTLDYVMPRGCALLGRANDLARLEAYAFGSDGSDPRPIVVSGDGGVGKSALLATLIRNLRRRSGVAVVLLDFDRPSLAGGDPAEIAREILRGLERALPRLLPHNADPAPTSKALALVRELLVSRRRVEGARDNRIVEIHAEEQFSIASSQLGTLAQALPPEVLSAPLLIVADTFEIAMMRGPETVKRTLDLFRFLRERFGFARSRVILSGRALEERLAPANAPHVAQDLAPMENWLALEGVNGRAGAAILRQLDKDYDRLPDPAQRLAAARALNGHPLALKIFQLYVRDKDPATIATILIDLHADEGFAKETALRFLYGRILERLSTPEVKAIARPGLILRRVSPDLIRLVLAGPCGLGEIDVARASELFVQLVSNYWLIEDCGAGVARHRADLRRQMLPALLVDMPEKARALNQRAAAYYEQGPAPDDPGQVAWRALDADERDAEAIYHRALARETPPEEFETGRARRIRDRLGEDLPMLENRWRIVILASARSWREIDEAWIDAESLAPLSPTLRAELIHRVSATMISSGDSSRAQQIMKLSPTGEMTPVDEDADVLAFESISASNTSLDELGLDVEASFNRADISRAAAFAKKLLDLYFFTYSGRLSRNYSYLFWLAALAVAATDRSYPLKKIVIEPAHPDSKTPIAIEVLLTGAFDSIAPGDRSKFIETYLSNHRASLDTLDLAVLLSALDLSHYSPNMSIRLLKDRASLRFLFNTLLEESGPNEPRIALGVLTSKAMRDLGDAPAKAQIDRVYSADDAVTFYLPGDWDLVTPYSLRGLSPELHEPSAFVLTECGLQDIHVWIEEVAAKARWWPSNLRFEGEGHPRFDKRDAFSVVVSTDRCGLLRDLLQWLSVRDERARDLLAIHDIVTERLFSFTHSQ